MRSVLRVFLVFASAAVLTCYGGTALYAGIENTEVLPNDPKAGVPSIITPGTYAADIVMVGTPETHEIAQKMKQALLKNTGWWKEFVQKNMKPGQPLPYHDNMGISQDEYTRLQELTQKNSLNKVGDAQLKVEKDKSGKLTFTLESKNGGFTNVSLDLAGNVVETPFGKSKNMVYIAPSEKQKSTGPWSGYRWAGSSLPEDVNLTAEDMQKMSYQVVDFSIGFFKDTKKALLVYRGYKIDAGKVSGRVDVFLTFTKK